MRTFIKGALASATAITIAIPAVASAATYMPTGPQTNVALATVTGGGWTQCYSATYATPLGGSISDELAGCAGSSIMYAARETGSSTLLLLAQALKTDVTFNTGAANNGVTHNANGSEWYYSDNWSVGFANSGDAVNKFECDTNAGPLRLCWHTINNTGGYRVGNITGLNSSTAYEKLIFFANDGGAVPESATWMMMIVGFGAAGSAMRYRRRKTSVTFA